MKVHIINPSGTNTDTFITDKGDGTYRVEYTAFEDGRRKVLTDSVNSHSQRFIRWRGIKQ